jgi:hypothetical protein
MLIAPQYPARFQPWEQFRGVAQPGRALALGARSREFESRRPDHFSTSIGQWLWFIYLPAGDAKLALSPLEVLKLILPYRIKNEARSTGTAPRKKNPFQS